MRTYGPTPGEWIFDSNPQRELEYEFALSSGQRQQLRRMSTDGKSMKAILDFGVDLASGAGFNTIGPAFSFGNLTRSSAYLSAGQTGPLQEYREELTDSVRSLATQLRTFDSAVLPPPSTSPLVVGQIWDSWDAARCASYINVSAPSLDPDYWIADGRMSIQEEILAFLTSAVFETRAAIQSAMLWFQGVLDFVGLHLAVILAVVFFPANFCSVYWENRRWYLFHGARPPRAANEAMSGLFAGACLGPLPIA